MIFFRVVYTSLFSSLILDEWASGCLLRWWRSMVCAQYAISRDFVRTNSVLSTVYVFTNFCPVSYKPRRRRAGFAQWCCSHLLAFEPRQKFGLSRLVFLSTRWADVEDRPAGLEADFRRGYSGLGGGFSWLLAHGSVVFHIKIREMERGGKTRAHTRTIALGLVWNVRSEVCIRSDSGTILARTQ